MTYRIISELTQQQVLELTELYSHEFWSHHRTAPDVEAMLKASDIVIGIVDTQDQLVGFTRILTDFVYRAVIFDVIIKSTHRQQGLGKQLLDAVIEHPQLQDVEYLSLFCLPEMIPFYKRWGFTSDTYGMQLMLRPHKPMQ